MSTVPVSTNKRTSNDGGNDQSRFTVTNTTNKSSGPAVAPVRRGRGTFSHSLRTEEHERQIQQARDRSETASAFTSTTVVTVSLPAPSIAPTSSLSLTNNNNSITTSNSTVNNTTNSNTTNNSTKKSHTKSTIDSMEAMLVGASDKKDIPLSAAPIWREQFGVELGEREEADTVRQVLFRGDKRRRCCIIVGDLQNVERPVTLKLFGHRGLKPFQLQNKVIRLINLSAGRQRVNRHLMSNETTLEAEVEKDVSLDEGDAMINNETLGRNNENEVESKEQQELNFVKNRGEYLKETEQAGNTALLISSMKGMEISKAIKPDISDSSDRCEDATNDYVTNNNNNNNNNNILAWEQEVAYSSTTNHSKTDEHIANMTRENDQNVVKSTTAFECKDNNRRWKEMLLEQKQKEEQEENSHREEQQETLHVALETTYDEKSNTAKLNNNKNEKNSSAHGDKKDISVCESKNDNKSFIQTTCTTSNGDDMDVEFNDIDHYWENVDEVAPLTIQSDDNANEFVTERRIANSPLLTAKYFDSLTEYFMREFRYLLSLEDVRMQNVTVDVSLGAAYYCLPRHCSYNTPLKNATFAEFVERINQESLQLYFIKDCPECVLRAVDMECGSLYHEANLTTVRIIFFSNERQSKTIARAVWDVSLNKFRLLDVENVGVSFNWTVFSIDETYAIAKAKAQSSKKVKEASTALLSKSEQCNAISTTTKTNGGVDRSILHNADGVGSITAEEEKRAEQQAVEAAMRNKTAAYPFEVEFRAFRRWKQRGDHPAHTLAQAILDKLSIAENNLLQHGSNVGYERMDLTHVCEVDFASEDYNVEAIIVDHTARGRPAGTDLLVDNTTSLHIENFAAARQLKEKIGQYGEEAVAAMQNPYNNNYMRSRAHKLGIRIKPNEDAPESYRFASRRQQNVFLTPEEMREALKPPAKLTFFRSTGSIIHWKFKPTRKVEDNIAPMTEALRFVQQVLNTANDIERTSALESAKITQAAQTSQCIQ